MCHKVTVLLILCGSEQCQHTNHTTIFFLLVVINTLDATEEIYNPFVVSYVTQ